MERRTARLAWAIAVTTATLVVAGLTLLLLTLDQPPQGGWGFRGFPVIFAVSSGTVGWLIMVRRPDNRIGLVLACVGALNGAQLFLTEYASAALHQQLPASNVTAWVNSFIWVPTVALMAGGTPLFFPDGRLPSPRWRPAGWLILGGAVGLTAIITAYPNALGTIRLVRPVVTIPIDSAVLNAASYFALAILGGGIVIAVISLIRRWRRSTGVVREQLKWLALSGALVVATMGLSVIPGPVPSGIFIAAIATIPVAVGVAVLRYRLYEIDAVINRTFVYGALTAILTGGFAALLKLLQTIFVSVTGNESDAATIITTLILATSFAPLKRALEKVAERRLVERGAEASAAGTPPGVRPAEAPAATADLEMMLRRVVREELRAARADVSEEAPTA